MTKDELTRDEAIEILAEELGLTRQQVEKSWAVLAKIIESWILEDGGYSTDARQRADRWLEQVS